MDRGVDRNDQAIDRPQALLWVDKEPLPVGRDYIDGDCANLRAPGLTVFRAAWSARREKASCTALCLPSARFTAKGL